MPKIKKITPPISDYNLKYKSLNFLDFLIRVDPESFSSKFLVFYVFPFLQTFIGICMSRPSFMLL